jgi:hypothetical protein
MKAMTLSALRSAPLPRPKTGWVAPEVSIARHRGGIPDGVQDAARPSHSLLSEPTRPKGARTTTTHPRLKFFRRHATSASARFRIWCRFGRPSVASVQNCPDLSDIEVGLLPRCGCCYTAGQAGQNVLTWRRASVFRSMGVRATGRAMDEVGAD